MKSRSTASKILDSNKLSKDLLLSDKITVRRASPKDARSLREIDRSVIGNQTRFKFLESSVSNGNCLLAKLANVPAGFAIYDQGSFFDQTFIWLLVTSPQFRRRGVASSLILEIMHLCKTRKLFTSTNQSNKAMQGVMKKLRFKRCGKVSDLDPGDPEIFYVKRLRRKERV
jgi:ribosomal protein S18 acetylase RimI-like enzyme